MSADILDSPRFVDKWAHQYIKLYRSVGSIQAKKWALEFLGPEPRGRMVVRVNELLAQEKN